MTEWEFVSVALSLVLGLAVTLVLRSALVAFRARHEAKLDPIAIAWAVYIFVSQLQYWWGPVRALSDLERITGTIFILMIVLAVMLFLAGGLVLPVSEDRYPTDLSEYFEKDGRWGVLIYSAYWLLGVSGVSIWIHGVGFSLTNVTATILIPLSALAVWVPRARTAVTILFGVTLVINTFAANLTLLRVLGIED